MKKNLLFVRLSCVMLLLILFVSCQLNDENVETSFNESSNNVTENLKIDAGSLCVDVEDAANVAILFSKKHPETRLASNDVLSVTPYVDNNGNALFYCVQFVNNGYVLVSSNKKAIPILGYSNSGFFDSSNGGMQVWLDEVCSALTKIYSDTTAVYDFEWLRFVKSAQVPMPTRVSHNMDTWKYEMQKEVKGKSEYIRLADYEYYSCEFIDYDDLNKYVPEEQLTDLQTQLVRECEELGYSKDDIFCQVFLCGDDEEVGPLLSTDWSQNAPYNGAVSGNLGCVTVAVGQFMNYYRYPTYKNWTEISSYGSTEQQVFLKEVGERLGIDYTSSDRGATIDDALRVLGNYGYEVYKTEDISDGDLRHNIYDNNQVVICRGRTNQILGMDAGDGHMWVIDGVRTGRSDIIVDIYAPLKSLYVSREVPEDENPYHIYIETHPGSYRSSLYFHMNWGGSLSWNAAGDYYCSANGKIYKRNKKFLLKK